jgi:hypothetical protein
MTMSSRKRLHASALFAFGLALGLAGGSAAMATGPHSHAGGAGMTTLEPQLDQGRRWPTDEVLRTGMTEMRGAMAAALPRIHADQLPSAEYGALAERVQAQVDYVVENCRLPEAADQQLHLVLAQVLEGTEALRDAGTREAGAVAIVRALDAYGGAFDHPGWEPLGH